MPTKTKKQKSVNAKNSKRISKKVTDYGTSTKKVKPPSWAKNKVEIPNKFFKFDSIDQVLEGIYMGVEKANKKGYTDNIIIKLEDGTQVKTSASYELQVKIIDNEKIIEGKTKVWIRLDSVIPMKGKNPMKVFEVMY